METKLGQSFQAFRSEKQKQTTSVVSQLSGHKEAATQGPDPELLIHLFRWIKCW